MKVMLNKIRQHDIQTLAIALAIAIVPTIGWGIRYWAMLPLYYCQMLPMLIIGMLVVEEAAIQFKTRKEQKCFVQE